jgi:hypothetical protein
MKFGIHNSSWLDSPDPAEARTNLNYLGQYGAGD